MSNKTTNVQAVYADLTPGQAFHIGWDTINTYEKDTDTHAYRLHCLTGERAGRVRLSSPTAYVRVAVRPGSGE